MRINYSIHYTVKYGTLRLSVALNRTATASQTVGLLAMEPMCGKGRCMAIL